MKRQSLLLTAVIAILVLMGTAGRCFAWCGDCAPGYGVWIEASVDGVNWQTTGPNGYPELCITVSPGQVVYFQAYTIDDYDTAENCSVVADSMDAVIWDADMGNPPDFQDPEPTTWSRSEPGTYRVCVAQDDGGTAAPNNCSDWDEGIDGQRLWEWCNLPDGPCECVTIIVDPMTVHLTNPTNGEQIACDTEDGVRETLRFYAWAVVQLQPVERAPQTTVTIYWEKAGQENSATMQYFGGGLFGYYLDITQRYTNSDSPGVSNRYRMRAVARYQGQDYPAPERPYFCILKGTQIALVASDFEHYPYQWGSKGPNECSNRQDHGLPADGYYWHEPYDNENHPAGSAWHPCCFDCSGYVYTAYRICGITVPTGRAAEQCSFLPGVTTPHRGDVLCYCCNNYGEVKHIAMYMAPGRWHAPQTGEWTRLDSDEGSPTSRAGPSGWGWCMDEVCSHHQ
jgi:hypothetical protein